MQQPTTRNELFKILGVGFGVAVTVGGTIGTGILRKPGPIAEQLGDPGLIMVLWVAVSVYAFLGTLCTIELGTSVPRAGAWYVYAQRAFGNYAGFVVGINSWLGTCSALGFGVYTMSEYLALLIPRLVGFESYVAAAILLALTMIHWIGLALASSFQNVMSLLKGIGLFAFVAVCYVYGNEVTTEEAQVTTSKIIETGSWLAPVVFSLQAIFYTYDGWHTAAYFSEEDRDPSKNLPKSMIGGVLVIIAIYLLCNLAILHVLPMDRLAQSKLAAADAITLIFGTGSGKIVTLFLMISILGIVNAQLLFNPRVLYSMSRDGLFLKSGVTVNQGGTPAVAMLVTSAVAITLILIGKDATEKLSDIATFFFVLGYASGFASLLALRKKEPHLPRPWKVPAYPFLPIIMLILSIAFLVGAIVQDLPSSQYALLFLLISYPVYLLVSQLNK
ncbi:amino acid/polyamine/organocation transporter, APC superfamily [Dyadobacter soli]|uniref:Amino acid/polyamine/organocation transporter, APC superfamily n=1 Tax=Dyadobacter soli TaxID=659014 RepID=A0A1G8BF52_9BACT|nr:amino acid permease [Dyadobacter soli]SDH31862.1 amino acid/polyamine/organocation transporter, APC superfamily [Dyadobacter soli]